MGFIFAILAIIVVVAVFFVLYFIGTAIEPLLLLLTPTAEIIIAILFLIGMNVLAYFASYKWNRKRWYFWLCLSLTVLFLLLVLSYAV